MNPDRPARVKVACINWLTPDAPHAMAGGTSGRDGGGEAASDAQDAHPADHPQPMTRRPWGFTEFPRRPTDEHLV